MDLAAEDLEITATCSNGKARYDRCKECSERTEFGNHWVYILEVQLDIWTKVVQTASLTNSHSRTQDTGKR